MSANELTYVVCAPSFSENNGGAIFMHELVNALNSLGERAYLWPMAPIYRQGVRARIKSWIRPPPYHRSPRLDTPLATRSQLGPSTVAVYPEIVRGNPLRVTNVVRWLLYKPGELHPYEFGSNEMFCRAGEIADIPEITGGAPDLFLWRVNRTYRNENRRNRQGACFIVRKGRDKPRIPETEAPDAIQIDGMSHQEINDVFNRCEVFYSYDEATMYSQYAAVAGCLSVVVPGAYSSRQEWAAQHDLGRYGVAYGLDDLDHARATQHKVIELLEEKERQGLATVERFVSLTKERFLNYR